MLDMNLQFFADEEVEISTGAEEPETAEPAEVEEVETEESEAPAEPELDRNAIFADARRRAEAEAKEAQSKIDAEFARMFGNYTNPKTGKPIQSARDYAEAFAEQNRKDAETKLRRNGVDPAIIEQIVQNTPEVREAKQLREEIERQKAFEQVQKDVAELQRFDASIEEFKDVPQEVIKLASERNFNLVEAYKILNFDKRKQSDDEAVRQRAINEVKGKAHLTPMNGVATADNLVEIPNEQKSLWRTMFPDKSASELKKLYNNSLQ